MNIYKNLNAWLIVKIYADQNKKARAAFTLLILTNMQWKNV